ncbi:hypothetical protein C7A11_26515 [Pseudomonas simiae]|uniref:hypothetical protein n=1 Tax=Pseudomonas simiae TaxID=321846 RepID=UPI000D023EEC|nr:hypothetical protein [Pseudomonas simiae]PRW84344.1 hypothetical protein C7A11_26515 [Pseudomonas simiae]
MRKSDFSDFVNRTARTLKFFKAFIDKDHCKYDFKSMFKFKAFHSFLGMIAIRQYILIRGIDDATYIEFHYLLKKIEEHALKKGVTQGISTLGMTKIYGGKFQLTKLVGFELLDAMYLEIKERKSADGGCISDEVTG